MTNETKKSNKVSVSIPEEYGPEFLYILDIILTDFLGLSWQQSTTTCSDLKITTEFNSSSLTLNSDFFHKFATAGLSSDLIPSGPLKHWHSSNSDLEIDLSEKDIPVLFGNPKIKMKDNSIYLGIDIFGAAFFMLSGLEEQVIKERDHHERFMASSSLAYKEGFLERPIIDEYVEILWAVMHRLWPDLNRKKSHGTTYVSCDIDHPFDRVGSNLIKLIKSVGADIVYRRNFSLATKRLKNFLCPDKGDHSEDLFYTFPWYMDVCEENDRIAAFYFITDHTAGEIDGTYDIQDNRILKLIKNITERGHEIGVHGSYNSIKDSNQILIEREKIIKAGKDIGLNIEPIGNRQHYLRWEAGSTPDYLDAAGYEYDTTGSFADHVGFRYGTAKTFSMWSWMNRTKLRIKQRPLIVMEVTLQSPSYMNLGHSKECYDKIALLRKRSLKYGGNFSILWHNSSLLIKEDEQLFLFAIQ